MSTASDRYFSLMMMMRQKKNVCWQRHKNDISPLTDASYLMFVISYNSLRMSTHLCGIEVECERTRLILKHYFNCSKHKHRPSNPVRRMTKLCFISFFFFIQYIYKKKGGVGGGGEGTVTNLRLMRVAAGCVCYDMIGGERIISWSIRSDRRTVTVNRYDAVSAWLDT